MLRTRATRRAVLLEGVNGRIRIAAGRNARNESIFAFAQLVCLFGSLTRLMTDFEQDAALPYLFFWALRVSLVIAIAWRCFIDDRDRKRYPLVPPPKQSGRPQRT